MIETNGKGTQNKQDLRDLLGVEERNPFKANSEAKLVEKMSDMMLVDLQRFAIEAGVSATGTVPSLKKKILKAFASYISRKRLLNKKGFILGGNQNDPFTKEQREEVAELNV